MKPKADESGGAPCAAAISCKAQGRRRRHLLAIVIAVMFVAATASAQRPQPLIPASASTVIERLPRGYAALEPTSATPSPATVAQINQLLTTASQTGDTRLAARAEALLARFPAQDTTSDVLRARAFSAQHRHDFSQALHWLDILIKRDPRDGDARLSHAQIDLVQGRIRQTRGQCAALALEIDAGRGLLCTAFLALRLGQYPSATLLATRWLDGSENDTELRRYGIVLRAEIAGRSHAADADDWFRKSLALAPQDVRTLAAFSRHLRVGGRYREVLQLLANAPDSETLSLERALVARALRAPDAAALADSLARRYRLAHALGLQPELREEAEFMLTLRGDAAGALSIAQRNFVNQRDVEDVDLLQRAAIAAKRPDALASLNAWAAAERLTLPAPGVKPK